MQKPLLKQEIATIAANYAILVNVIKQLEGGSLKLRTALNLVDDVSKAIETAPGLRGEEIRNKLHSVLTKNEGFQWMKKVADALDNVGNAAEVLDFYTIDELLHLNFAQITSCEVERSFSYYKFILGNRRRRFNIENLSMHFTIAVNQALSMLVGFAINL